MPACLDSTVGDGRLGYPDKAPYDAIHVGAAAAVVPEAVSTGKKFLVPQTSTGKRLYSRFPRPGFIGSPVQYWKRFCRFPSPVLGKGSTCSQVQYWEGSIGFPVQYCEKVCHEKSGPP